MFRCGSSGGGTADTVCGTALFALIPYAQVMEVI